MSQTADERTSGPKNRKRRRIPMNVVEAAPGPRPVPRALRRGKMPEELLDTVRLMMRGGATDIEICTVLGIHVDTLYNWRDKSPQLAEMMRTYKDGFDIRIERSLAQSALGYVYPSEEIKVIDGQVHRIPISVHVQPSNTAQIFWLKNRQPWMWRDRHELDVKGDLNVTEVPDDRKLAMQLLALLREAQQQPIIEGMTNEPDVATTPASTPGSEGRRRRFA